MRAAGVVAADEGQSVGHGKESAVYSEKQWSTHEGFKQGSSMI